MNVCERETINQIIRRRSKVKMVAARIIFVAAVALALTSTAAAGDAKADCLNRCISKCVDSRGGLCTFNCAIGCQWPVSEPTGEVLVSSKGQHQIDPAAMQAAFAMHKEPADPAPMATAPQN